MPAVHQVEDPVCDDKSPAFGADAVPPLCQLVKRDDLGHVYMWSCLFRRAEEFDEFCGDWLELFDVRVLSGGDADSLAGLLSQEDASHGGVV